MADVEDLLQPPKQRGCLVSAMGLVILTVTAPVVAVIRSLSSWRRGGDIRVVVTNEAVAGKADHPRRRLDLTCDAPISAAPGVRDRVTDAVVRTAELLHRPEVAYHLVYRVRGDEEAVALPVGSSLQSLGERFRLCLAQGPLAGRTAMWLALDRRRALSDVVDSATCDPDVDDVREHLLAAADSWGMATSWARSGPSWVLRMVVEVPAPAADRVQVLLQRTGRG
jgi:hypothetical protein